MIELPNTQRQILKLIAKGYSNKRISKEIFLSPSTIATHITEIYLKLGVSSEDGYSPRVLAAKWYWKNKEITDKEVY